MRSSRPERDEAAKWLLPASRELLQRRGVHRQRRAVRARPLALRRCPAPGAVSRRVVPRAGVEPLRRRRALSARRAGGGAVGHGRTGTPRGRDARGRRRGPVRDRHPLTDPARGAERHDLRVRRTASTPPPMTIFKPSASPVGSLGRRSAIYGRSHRSRTTPSPADTDWLWELGGTIPHKSHNQLAGPQPACRAGVVLASWPTCD